MRRMPSPTRVHCCRHHRPTIFERMEALKKVMRVGGEIDIITMNMIIRLLGEEILLYPPESKESIALMRFMERLSE